MNLELFIIAAVDLFKLNNKRVELSITQSNESYSIVVSFSTIYIYNSLNDLIESRPVA